MTKKCIICKKQFKTYHSKIKIGRGKCCSKKCKNILQSKTWKGKYPKSFQIFYKNNPNFRHQKKSSVVTKNKISLAVKKLWKNKEYKNHMKKIHRKKVSKRGNYLQIYYPQHPRVNERGYVYQHIIIMEKIIGRYLKPKEIIHHIDGNRYNNSENNLMLFKSRGQHINFHRRNRIKSFAKLV